MSIKDREKGDAKRAPSGGKKYGYSFMGREDFVELGFMMDLGTSVNDIHR
jgi:hypothetical protein